jgi:hypothetical protein
MPAFFRPLFGLLLALMLGTSQATVISATFSGTFQGIAGAVGGGPRGPYTLNAVLAGSLSITEPTGIADYDPDSGITAYSGYLAPYTAWAKTAFTLSHPTEGTLSYEFDLPLILFQQSDDHQTLGMLALLGKYHVAIDLQGAIGSLFSSADPARFNPRPSWSDIDSAVLSFSYPGLGGKGVITNMVFANQVDAPPAIALVTPALVLLIAMRRRRQKES